MSFWQLVFANVVAHVVGFFVAMCVVGVLAICIVVVEWIAHRPRPRIEVRS